MTTYLPERVWPRLVPKDAVSVSIFGGDDEHGFGVLADLSRGGARITSEASFPMGCRVLLRIGFDPAAPFSLPGEIVWLGDEWTDAGVATIAYGVKFDIEDPVQRARLEAILESSDFGPPTAPALREHRKPEG